MYNGQTSYNSDKLTHTCIIVMTSERGAFHAVMWDGEPTGKDWKRPHKYYGTFVRGNNKIHVLVYGGIMSKETIIGLLGDWMKGEWEQTALNDLEAPPDTPMGK